MSIKSFVVALLPADLEALNDRVEAGARAEAEWLAEARKGLRGLRGSDASAARLAIRLDRDGLRERGVLAGTRAAVLSVALRSILRQRGLDREWPEPPAGETSAPGRRWGSIQRAGIADDEPFEGRMEVKLPQDLGERLVRACYWTNAPTVEELKRWFGRFGDGPVVRMRDAAAAGVPGELAAWSAASGRRPTREELEARDKLRESIITTGDLLREAVQVAIRRT